MRSLARSVLLAGALLLHFNLHAAENLVAISEDELERDEASIWLAVNKEEQAIRTSSSNVDDPELTEHASLILCNLVGSACSAFRPYVIRSPGFNAFIMPNGAMFLQTGMLLRVKDDSELAAVIGHEASHYFNRHTLQQVRRVFRTNDALAVIGAFVSGTDAAGIFQVGAILAQLQLLSYSRDMETEADSDGVTWMSEASFDPMAALSLWRGRIAEETEGESDSGLSLNFLRTHPAPPDRLNKLSTHVSTLTEGGSVEGMRPDRDISELVDKYREDWLLDEMSALHPDQFSHLLSYQVEQGYPSHDAAYLEGVNYSDKAKRSDSEQRQEYYKRALAAFEKVLANGDEHAKPETHRRLGELHESLGDLAQAKAAYRRYVELAPDAWDAKFIRRKL